MSNNNHEAYFNIKILLEIRQAGLRLVREHNHHQKASTCMTYKYTFDLQVHV